MTAAEPSHVFHLRELPQDREFSLPAAFVARTIAGMPMREALEPPEDDPDAGFADVRVHLYADDDANVFVRGRLRGWLKVACSRCIGPVRVVVDEELAVTFVPGRRLPKLEAEDAEADEDAGVELSAEDLDLYGYDGETVDLEPLLRELLVLAVPYAPLCRESCLGLCPQCGVDRNQETCACQPTIDPRLAALRVDTTEIAEPSWPFQAAWRLTPGSPWSSGGTTPAWPRRRQAGGPRATRCDDQYRQPRS